MKVKSKVRNSNKAVLQEFATSKIDLRLTKIVEELLPLLIGMELYFGVSAQQYVRNLELPNEEAVVGLLVRMGYAKGSTMSWTLSNEVLKTAHDRLLKCGLFERKPGFNASDESIPVQTLVKLYTWHLSRVPKQHQGQRVTNKFAFFRKLSKKHNSTKIAEQIKRFFDYESQGNNNYRMETFAKYLEGIS
jgi:hypothetical protein